MNHLDTGWKLVWFQYSSTFLLSLCVTFIFMFANGHCSASHHVLAGKGEEQETKGAFYLRLPFILNIF